VRYSVEMEQIQEVLAVALTSLATFSVAIAMTYAEDILTKGNLQHEDHNNLM